MYKRLLRQLWNILFLVMVAIILPLYIFNNGNIPDKFFIISTVYFLFLLGSVWQAIVYGYYSKSKDEINAQKQIGKFIYRFQIIGIWLVHWVGAFDYSYYASFTNIMNKDLLFQVGFSICFLATIIIHLSVRKLGIFFDRLVIKNNHRLITNGIYGTIRHPVYLSYYLLFLGITFCFASIVAFILSVLVCSVSFKRFIDTEEKMLSERFGQEFESYKKKTKKLIPYIY